MFIHFALREFRRGANRPNASTRNPHWLRPHSQRAGHLVCSPCHENPPTPREELVGEPSLESSGGGGLSVKKSYPRHLGFRRGGAIRCSPHAPRRFPRGWEGQGSTRVRLRAARRVFGIPGSDSGCHFRPSKHCFRSTLLLRRARQASDPAELIKVVCHGSSFGVGGSGRQPISYPPTPRGVWGRGEKELLVPGVV